MSANAIPGESWRLIGRRELSAVGHGHRGRRAPNATPETVATAVVHLARTKYARANHTHLSELLSEREGIDIGRSTLRRILVVKGGGKTYHCGGERVYHRDNG